jgi:hypothetical protein
VLIDEALDKKFLTSFGDDKLRTMVGQIKFKKKSNIKI